MKITDFFKTPFNSPGDLISTLVPNIIILAGVTLFILMVGGGFMMIKGAGNDDPKAVSQGKAAVTYAVVGFLLVVCAYFILQILEVVTGIKFINPVIFQ